jgi:NAD-dependent dihydropyrimidine dehydrogenase PreA subunit
MHSKNYLALQKRLDMSPQGAPYSETLMKILEHLFTDKEAGLTALLPINFFTPKKASKLWGMKEDEAEDILDKLAGKGILLDVDKGKGREFIMAPTMAGFFEFSIMRTDGKFDRKLLSELYHQYINVEEDFLKVILDGKPHIARVFVHEDTVKEHKGVILNYERATKAIENATAFAVGTCYCRYKMDQVTSACDQPQEVCLSFNNAAKSLAKHGIARKITKEESLKILKECKDKGLVQVGDNVQKNIGWICNCCGCCCEALLAYKRLGHAPRLESNFYCEIDNDKCKTCGICIKKCPVDAISKKGNKIVVDKDKCLGCGVCLRFCPANSMKMHKRSENNFTPRDSFERFVLTAINSGKLQNLLVDNHKLWSADMLRRLVGVILKLPPAKQILASRQMQSKFLSWVTKTDYHDGYDKGYD